MTNIIDNTSTDAAVSRAVEAHGHLGKLKGSHRCV